jgi:hypothetical protein
MADGIINFVYDYTFRLLLYTLFIIIHFVYHTGARLDVAGRNGRRHCQCVLQFLGPSRSVFQHVIVGSPWPRRQWYYTFFYHYTFCLSLYILFQRVIVGPPWPRR